MSYTMADNDLTIQAAKLPATMVLTWLTWNITALTPAELNVQLNMCFADTDIFCVHKVWGTL